MDQRKVHLAVFFAALVLLFGCGDSTLPTVAPVEGPSNNTYPLKPVVAEVSGCSNPTWWRDANGQCWPPDPTGGSTTSPGEASGDPGQGAEPWGGGGGDPGDDPEPGDDSWNPDPDGSCNASITTAWADGASAACDDEEGPFMLKSVKLEGCPEHAEGPSATGIRGIQYYDLTRPGKIRSKSWGGVVRYDVAFYRGEVIRWDGVPAAVSGEVWCSAGIGIFTYT